MEYAALIATAASAIGGAINSSMAREERRNAYNKSKAYLNAEYYRDPLSTIGNRALLKSFDERMKDSNDALQNRAAAGGATFENQLAARQANNETMSNLYSNLLMGEDARRAAISQRKMQLENDYSAGVQAEHLADAQNWQAWGSQMSNAALSYGSASLLEKK